MTLVFKLVKSAKKLGGDRYEAEVPGDDRAFVVYFPQSITRTTGMPKQTITMTLEV
jgi:hypothetical protein